MSEWLAEPRRHVTVGATFDPDGREGQITEYAYAGAFDAVCYVDETSRARPIVGE